MVATLNKPFRRRPVPREKNMQIMVVNWLRDALPDVLTVHIPNGGRRSRKEGADFKRMGVLAGMPDLMLLWDGGIGFIEMKSQKGNLQPNQQAMLDRLAMLGGKIAVCKSVKEAEAVVKGWGLFPQFPAPKMLEDFAKEQQL